jgi:peptidyl-prolyl cis-trans isomerase D
MFKSMDRKKVGVRILLGFLVLLLSASMLNYLIPGSTSGSNDITGADTVAQVAGREVTRAEVQKQLQRIQSSGRMPAQLAPLYAQQIIQTLVVQKMLEAEAERLGITVSAKEIGDRIKLFIPTAFQGDYRVPYEQYAAEISTRMPGTSVEEFEEMVRQSILVDKVQELVTSTATVSPVEIQAEFRRKNEKVKLDYVVIHPDSLESQVTVSDAELAAFYERNKVRYTLPEQRVVRYFLIDPVELQAKATVSPAELLAYYNAHLAEYQVEDRVQVSHILFKTPGKTDAEIAEIHKKAADVLKQVKSGGKFDELAKKNSEDSTKDRGGEIGWIGRGQAPPEFERVAFGLPKGGVSDIVQTEMGLHIIKVSDKETAHTKSLTEMVPVILGTLGQQKAQATADDMSQKIGSQIRQNGKISLDALAKLYGLTLGETRPIAAGAPAPELGNAPELQETIFHLREGEVSTPIHTDRGYAVVTVKEVVPAHQGTLGEVHDNVTADFRHEKVQDLARQRAADLAKRAQRGEDFAKAAKALKLESKTSDAVARDGSITGAGALKQIPTAFTVAVGKTGDAVFLGSDWLVFHVAEHTQPNPADFDKQKKEIELQLLDAKRQLAFESFREALDVEMRRTGKLKYNQEVVNKLTRPG